MNTAAPHMTRLQGHIAAVRRRRLGVKTLTGVAMALSVIVGVFTAEAALDRLVNLPWIARAVVFLGCFGAAGYFLWRETIAPLLKQLDDDSVALLIEHALPVFRTRFIASIQLARNAGPRTSTLVRALVVQTAVMAKTLSFREVVKTGRLKRSIKRCAGIITISVLLIFLNGHASMLLFRRAMLSNVMLPGWTYFVSVTGDKNIGYGEDLKIDVTVGGMAPSRGRVMTTSDSGLKREFALTPDANDPRKFSTVIHSPQESFRYIVKLGDATSVSYRVQAFKRPTVAGIACRQLFPTYTKASPLSRDPTDLALLVGSRLVVTGTASGPIGKAWLCLAGLKKEEPMKIDPANPSILRGEIQIPSKDLTGFSLHLVSTEGIESGESVVYRIDLVSDQPPTAAIVIPITREGVVTPQATLPITFEAKDDFGVAKAALHYTIDQGEEKTIEFDMGKDLRKDLVRKFEWKLSLLQPHLGVGTIVEFWISVADNNIATGPGTGLTEHYQAKIVTDEEKRQDIANHLREVMDGVTQTTDSYIEATKALAQPLLQKQKDKP